MKPAWKTCKGAESSRVRERPFEKIFEKLLDLRRLVAKIDFSHKEKMINIVNA